VKPHFRQRVLFDRAVNAKDLGVMLVLDEHGNAIYVRSTSRSITWSRFQEVRAALSQASRRMSASIAPHTSRSTISRR
jgi:hypothetical protein